MTDQSGLWQAKAAVVAAFAGGPGVLIESEDERMQRLADLLVVVEMEYESSLPVSNVTPIRPPRPLRQSSVGDILHASNSRIDWSAVIEDLRRHPGKSITIGYDKMHTAVVSVKRIHEKYPDVDAISERTANGGGSMVLTARVRR